MRIFQSSITAKSLTLLDNYIPDIKINVLRSYQADGPGTFKIINSAKHCVKALILDSGTWGLNKQTLKSKITVQSYASFLEYNHNYFDAYFGFDPIHGDEGTEDSIINQIYLERLGFKPIPVLQNLDIETDYYCEKKDKYPFVAIGSTHQKDFKDVKKSVFKLYENGIKVHLFGIGSYKELIEAPAWSSDCSSFAQWTKNGRQIFYTNDKETSLAVRQYDKNGNLNKDYIRASKYCDDYEDWIYENFKLSLEDVIYNHDMCTMVNSYYFYELEKRVQEVHLKKGFVFDFY